MSTRIEPSLITLSARRLFAVVTSGSVVVLGLLAASCGGGDDGGAGSGEQYRLQINGPAQVSTTSESVTLSGTMSLPPGSTCSGGCVGLLPPPVFGTLGPYSLTWSNAATGSSGSMRATWVCNCGGSAPSWFQSVPVAVGVNVITITMNAQGATDQAAVTVTRQ